MKFLLFNCRKWPRVRQTSPVALCDFEPDGPGSQRELRPAVVFSKTSLKHRLVYTEGNFMELNYIYTLNLLGIMLLYCLVPLLSIILTLYSKYQAAITLGHMFI